MEPNMAMLRVVPYVVGSIIVVGALTRCTLLHSLYNLKAARMNMQQSLIRKPTLYV